MACTPVFDGRLFSYLSYLIFPFTFF